MNTTQRLRLQMFEVFGLSPAISRDELNRAYELLTDQYNPCYATGDPGLFQILNLAYTSCEQSLDANPSQLRRTNQSHPMLCQVCGCTTEHILEAVSIYLLFHRCEMCGAPLLIVNPNPRAVITLQEICRELGMSEPPVLARVLRFQELRRQEIEIGCARQNAEIRRMVLAERY